MVRTLLGAAKKGSCGTHHVDAAVSGDGNDGLKGSEIDT